MRWVNIGGVAFVGFLVLLTAGTVKLARDMAALSRYEPSLPKVAAAALPDTGPGVFRAQRLRTRTPNVRIYLPGAALAFVVNRPDQDGVLHLGGGGQELWWTRDGWKQPRRLLPREGGPTRGLQSPEFSPDGKRLLVRSVSGETAGLWVLELPDGKASQLPWTAEPWDRIEWLGDSRTLLLQHYPKDYQRTVSLCDTRTGSSTPIRALTTPGSRHGWQQAPDGRSLYFVKQDGALARLVRLSLPGQTEKIIGSVRLGPMHWQEANIVDLTISPDGRLVLFTGLGGAVIARLDGKVLHKDEAMAEDPNWSPDGRYAAWYTESPAMMDGQEMVGFGSSWVCLYDTKRRKATSSLSGGYGPDHRGPLLMGTVAAANAFLVGSARYQPSLWTPLGEKWRDIFGPDQAADIALWAPDRPGRRGRR